MPDHRLLMSPVLYSLVTWLRIARLPTHEKWEAAFDDSVGDLRDQTLVPIRLTAQVTLHLGRVL